MGPGEAGLECLSGLRDASRTVFGKAWSCLGSFLGAFERLLEAMSRAVFYLLVSVDDNI